MGQIVVRRLDDAVKERLKARAKARGVSMEEEARTILTSVLDEWPRVEARKGAGALAVEILRKHGFELQPNEFVEVFNDTFDPAKSAG